MSFMKSLARSGADGNTRLLKEYGGKESKAKAYANGGSVFDDEDDDDDMEGGESSMADTEVDGVSAKPRMDRPGRKMKDKDKKGGTNVNVIIMPKSDDGPAVGPAGPGPVAAAPMPPPPPMAPPMAGGPPMPPMRKHGGGVGAYANGGKVGKLPAEGQSLKTEAEAMASRKDGGRACKAEGGPAYGKIKDGAGGGLGRLQKIKAYGK